MTLLILMACGGQSEHPHDHEPIDASSCGRGTCATGGSAHTSADAGSTPDGAVPAGGTGGTGGTGTGGTGATAATGGTPNLDAGSTGAGTGGSGEASITPMPPAPPGIGCGDQVCDLGSGLKCCWAPVTDTYQCAETCPPDASTFECDDDGDCPEGTQCSWFGDGPEYTAPYRTACVDPGSVQRNLDCHWSDQCADGMTCCAELQELWIPEEGVFKHVINGAYCTAPERCPASAGAAPFCRSDADCPERRKCVRLDDAPSSMQTCSDLADSVADAVLIDCGDTQCVKELGLVCDSRWPRPEGLLPCRYKDPYSPSAGIYYLELDCDEQGDCLPGELCVLAYAGGDVSAICTTDPAGDSKPLDCKSTLDCADGYTCCVVYNVDTYGLYGPVAVGCTPTLQCTTYSYPRCQADADCAIGKHCYDTEVAGVRICK